MVTYSVAAILFAYVRIVEAQATICLATYGGVATRYVCRRAGHFSVSVSYLGLYFFYVESCLEESQDDTNIVIISVPPPGRDFIVQVSPYLGTFDPGEPGSGFLDSTGHLQSVCQKSSTFLLSSGHLYSGSNRVSVAPGVPFMRFGASEYAEAIDSIFAVDEAAEEMVWNNEAFSDGTARFCADSFGTLYAVFLGPLPPNCTATKLGIKDGKLAEIRPGTRESCDKFADC